MDRYLIPLLLLCMLIGCRVASDFQAPIPPTLNPGYCCETGNVFETERLAHWWESFDDPVLTDLLSRAEVQNLRLQHAQQRILNSQTQITSSHQGTLESDHDQIRLTLLADVAGCYFRIRSIQQQIEFTNESLEAQSKTNAILEQRFKDGLTSELDITQANALKERTAAILPALESDLLVQWNRMSLLLGETPGPRLRTELGDGVLPTPSELIGIGVPGDLIIHRPDIKRQEQVVINSTSRVYRLRAIRKSRNLLYTANANQANFDQLNAKYQQTVLEAVREVEDALAKQLGFTEQSAALQKAIESDKTAIELAQQRYVVGNADFQTLVELHEKLLQDQFRQVTAQLQTLLQQIEVYRAVGGGWDPVEMPGSFETKPLLPIAPQMETNADPPASKTIIRTPATNLSPANAQPMAYDLWAEN